MIKKSMLFFMVFIVLVGFIFAAGPLLSKSEDGFPDLLAQWFPSVFRDKSTVGPDPGETLQAPFIDRSTAAVDPQGQLGDLYEDNAESDANDNLGIAHRPAVQVGDWVKQKTAFMLSFAPEDYNEHRIEIRKLTSAKGFEEFEKFIAATNLMGALQNGNRDLHTYMLDNPELIHDAAVQGRYRWLFAAAVNLTLVPKGSDNYEQNVDTLNKQVIIQIQVGRVDNDENDGLQIESWQLRKR